VRLRMGMVGGGLDAMAGELHRRAAATRASRIPPGQPEGYYEAFGNLYRNFADAITARRHGAR